MLIRTFLKFVILGILSSCCRMIQVIHIYVPDIIKHLSLFLKILIILILLIFGPLGVSFLNLFLANLFSRAMTEKTIWEKLSKFLAPHPKNNFWPWTPNTNNKPFQKSNLSNGTMFSPPKPQKKQLNLYKHCYNMTLKKDLRHLQPY